MTTTTTGQTFANDLDALKKLALALGMKGAAGGWIYKPKPEHLTISGAGTVPNEWYGHHVTQSWRSLARRWGNRIGQTESGRFYVIGAKALYEDVKAKSSTAYAELLAAMADGAPEATVELLRARHEGWKVRVFAAHELAYGAQKARKVRS